MLWRKAKQRKLDGECYRRRVILNRVVGLRPTEKAPTESVLQGNKESTRQISSRKLSQTKATGNVNVPRWEHAWST